MIFKFAIVCALVAITASGSTLKGREESALKGGLKSPIEQQRLAERQRLIEQQQQTASLDESKEQYQKKEEIPLTAEHRNEDTFRETQQKEEAEPKGAHQQRYEAKPQLNQEEIKETSNNKLKPWAVQKQDEKFEQYSQQRDVESSLENQGQQAVELKEEQRKMVDEQPVLTQTVAEEPQRHEVQQTKGGAFLSQAPTGEAEPYSFSYNVDGSSRSESGDTKGVVRGQYTLSGSGGSNRVVDYVADSNGFKASVNTNEFGTESKSPASVVLRSSQPPAEEVALRAERRAVEGSKGAAFVAQKPLLFEEHVVSEGERKGFEPQKEQQQQLVQAPVLMSEAKGGRKAPMEQAPIAQSQLNWNEGARKGGREEIKREPIKGMKEQQRYEELQQRNIENYPAKSAEIRSPKASLASEYKYAVPMIERRDGFESATSHRVYRQPMNYVSRPLSPVRHRQPSVLVRAHPPAPVVRGSAPSVSRLNPHYKPLPLSPAQGYRRSHHRYEPSNPRVSFYGYNFDEDQAGFEPGF